MDLSVYSADDGDGMFKTRVKMGYSPARDEDTSGWFLGLPDGRLLVAVDRSLDTAEPNCRLYVAGPGKKQKKAERLSVPEAIEDTGWCRQASLNLSAAGVTVGYTVDGRPGYFSLS